MILGCEIPRIFSPPLRELTPDTTDGFACIAFAEQILAISLFPWQKWLLLHALELNEDFSYRFRIIVVEVARQSGKSLVMVILALWHIFAKGSRQVIATAQDLANAERAWALGVEYAQSDDELNELIEKITLAHPKVLAVRCPSIDKTCEYRVGSSSRRSIRGFSGDLILLDELREHQTWDSWAAVVNTMNARPNAQAWAFSNAGDALSIVLKYLRTSAHQSLGWPDGDADADILGETDADVADLEDDGDVIGWFEWSAAPTAKRTDRDAWAQANPSLNHVEVIANCVTEKTLASNLRTQPGHVFDQECMCRFTALSDGGPFPEGSWRDTLDNKAVAAADSRSAVCVEVSTSRSAVITKAGMDENGLPVIGVMEAKAGTDWIHGWLIANKDTYAGVVIRSGSGSPVLSELQELTDAGLPIVEWKAGEVGAAFGQLYDRVRDKTIRHLGHPGLDAAATSAATRPQPGGGWVVDINRSPVDVAPLYAATGAVWGLAQLPDNGPSIYSGPQGRSVLVF